MAWKIEYNPHVEKDLRAIDRKDQRRIQDFMNERVALLEDPRTIGDSLKGTLGGLWKYRVGDYRIICDIRDESVTVLVMRIGHRRKVYR
ncbi:type II toxin-antitoxin system RelE/ParE family toxin [Desulforhabdus sp. TSK]|uniref:type II toxin-antitoxin system RelE family toxin n=1 Tax=Desulforhabdus sp. TSK TaxID=2925014 RepID=UPI001FC81932|nr:type II toxin-antitoxin system RelE/ParE family toxin [Desulforhabdus sp. TSK]GKT07637.1 translation repressor RelE [Desulforhabdus sp. TSK]